MVKPGHGIVSHSGVWFGALGESAEGLAQDTATVVCQAAVTLPPGRKRLAVFATAGHNRVPVDPDFEGVYRSFLALVRAGLEA